MSYDRFFSHAADGMRESAIRKMGTLGARIPDLISFAPGSPDPALFPWDALREAAGDLLSGGDRAALQYGATRGYRPLLDRALRAPRVVFGIALSAFVASLAVSVLLGTEFAPTLREGTLQVRSTCLRARASNPPSSTANASRMFCGRSPR